MDKKAVMGAILIAWAAALQVGFVSLLHILQLFQIRCQRYTLLVLQFRFPSNFVSALANTLA